MIALAISQVKTGLGRFVIASAWAEAALSRFIFLWHRNGAHKRRVRRRHSRKEVWRRVVSPALTASLAGAWLPPHSFKMSAAPGTPANRPVAGGSLSTRLTIMSGFWRRRKARRELPLNAPRSAPWIDQGHARRQRDPRHVVGRAIRHAVGACIIGKMVAAAVGDGAITAGEFWQMLRPHPVVLKAAVNEYDRLALPDFHIGKLGAVGGDPFDAISHALRRSSWLTIKAPIAARK